MELTEVLRGGRQCDEDGVEIIMSRQACCEAADELDRLKEELFRMRAALNAAVLAMQAPIDGWKGEVERRALDIAHAVLAPNA